MNLPNKLTITRIVLSILIIIFLIFPFQTAGIGIPQLFINEKIVVDVKYLIAGVLFMLASITDFLDGYIARKNNLVTDFGKLMDAIADKMLVNGVLIILAYNHFLPVVVPVIIITRDIIVDSIKMASGSKGKVVAASWAGKIKTICMMIGVTLVFFYNMPFAFIAKGLHVDYFFVFVAVIMSIISGCQYYIVHKEFIFSEI